MDNHVQKAFLHIPTRTVILMSYIVHSPVTGCTSGRIAVAFCCPMVSVAPVLPLPVVPLVPGSSPPKLELAMESPLWLASMGLAWLVDPSSSESEAVTTAVADAWCCWSSERGEWEKAELAGPPVDEREEKLWLLVLYVCT